MNGARVRSAKSIGPQIHADKCRFFIRSPSTLHSASVRADDPLWHFSDWDLRKFFSGFDVQD